MRWVVLFFIDTLVIIASLAAAHFYIVMPLQLAGVWVVLVYAAAFVVSACVTKEIVKRLKLFKD